jgi:hypothetical protein
MKIYNRKAVEQDELFSIKCDRCEELHIDCAEGNIEEIENFVTISKSFSFGSVHDDDTYECDLCEKCAFEVLGEYWRKK